MPILAQDLNLLGKAKLRNLRGRPPEIQSMIDVMNSKPGVAGLWT